MAPHGQDRRSLLLRAEPDWAAAAQVLVDGCAHLPETGSRIELLERVCDALGSALYPALIGVLCTIGDRGSAAARSAVAATLVDALCSGRVPSGQRVAWGASTGTRATRSLGPVEYLCAWYAEPGMQGPLRITEFEPALHALLALVSQSDAARPLYCQRLCAVADDPLGGSLARSTRDGLRQLAASWERCGHDLSKPVGAFVRATDAAQDAGLSGIRALAGAYRAPPSAPTGLKAP